MGHSILGHLAQGLHWVGLWGSWRQSGHAPGAPRGLWAGGALGGHLGPKRSRSGVFQCALRLCPLAVTAAAIVSAEPGVLRGAPPSSRVGGTAPAGVG